jgi:hypothetical protein
MVGSMKKVSRKESSVSGRPRKLVTVTLRKENESQTLKVELFGGLEAFLSKA